MRRTLEILGDVRAMCLQRPRDALPQRRFKRTPFLQRADGPYPVDRTKTDFHRIDPVDTAAGRVGFEPGLELGLELARRLLVGEKARRPCKGQQLVSPAELPRHLRVAVVVETRDLEVHVELPRPPVPRLEVAMPVDLGTELSRARS